MSRVRVSQECEIVRTGRQDDHHFNPLLERKLAGLRLEYVLELAYDDISSYVTPRDSIVHSKKLKEIDS